MSVVVSLLRAIDRADGEALVMHVGEKPYVVTATGPAELAATTLTVPAMSGMLDQLLPPDSRQALEELGAVEYHLPPDHDSPRTRYSVVAARGGDDIWIEVRRRKEPEAPPEVQAAAPEAAPGPALVEAAAAPVEQQAEQPSLAAETAPHTAPHAAIEPPASTLDGFPGAPAEAEPEHGFELVGPTEEDLRPQPEPEDDRDDQHLYPDLPADPALDFTAAPPSRSEPEPEPQLEVAAPVARPVVRVSARVETPAFPAAQPGVDPLLHLLQVGAAQGASALYVATQAKPSLRIDGEIHVLDAPLLTETDLDTGLAALAGSRPSGDHEPFDVPNVGRVQFVRFRDHRGLGAVFKMLPARAISAQHIGLSAPIQALCTEPEGLLLVSGARSAGKSTLVAALVDQINRTRRDHVITIESQIQFVHENQSAFVSQREARDEGRFVDAVWTAIKEAPDVLVIDDVMSAEVARAALEAAVAGHMVVAAVTAPSTAGALERFIEFFRDGPSEARLTLADHLRGVIMQTLLRKTGGGRAAAREVLVNVPSVATLIGDGQFDQLGSVLNGGRHIGMVPLNDALLSLVQNGALDVRQAYRKSPDQGEFVTMLNRAGIDTSFAERLA